MNGMRNPQQSVNFVRKTNKTAVCCAEGTSALIRFVKINVKTVNTTTGQLRTTIRLLL